MKPEERLYMKTIAIFQKRWLKPEEAQIYMNLEGSSFSKKMKDYGVQKTSAGYYDKNTLDDLMAGKLSALHDLSIAL